MSIKLGVAPDSWGVWFADDPKQAPWRRYLDEIVVAGFSRTELGPYGYMPTDPAVLRRELEQRGLTAVALAEGGNLPEPTAWPALEKLATKACELLAGVGGLYFVLFDESYTDSKTGALTGPQTLDDAAWQRLIEATQRLADLVHRRFGLRLLFHPHAETHVETEPQIERFLRDTDPARVNLCFDTGHHAYRGGDPVAFMHKHHARIPFLHLKSIDAGVQRKVAAEHIPFARAVSMDMFVEPSKGAIDFIAFRDVLREVHYDGYAMVEQDMYPAPLDKPLPIAKRTHDYLIGIGIGS